MLLTVLLVSLCVMGSTAAKKVYRRQIVKEFSVGARPELALSNRFGEIRIVEGADRKITVRVELRGEGKTDEGRVGMPKPSTSTSRCRATEWRVGRPSKRSSVITAAVRRTSP